MVALPRTEPEAARSMWSLARQSVGFSLGGFAYKAIALLTVPFIARLLSPTELGLLDVAAVAASLIGILGALGTENAVARLQPIAQDERQVWAAAAEIVGIGVALVVFAGLVLRAPLAWLLTGSTTHEDLFVAALLYGATLTALTFSLNIVRLRNTPARYAIFGFILVVGEMAAAVGIALVVNDPVTLIVVSWAGVSIMGAVLILRGHLPLMRRADRELAMQMLRFGLPLVPAAIAWTIGDLGIRAAIAHGGDLKSLGEYGIAYRIVSVMTLVVGGFALAWHPFLYRSRSQRLSVQAIRAALGLGGILALVAVVLAVFGPTLALIVAGPRYVASASAVPWLAAGMVAFGMFVVLSAVEGVGYRTLPVAAASILGMAVQIGGAFILVPSSGIAGAGVASLLGYSVATLGLLADVLMRRSGGQ